MHVGATMAFSHETPVSYLVEAAQYLDDAGFHSVWLPEHVMFFPEYASRYPYSDDGRIGGDPHGLIDPLVALTFVAARTRQIRLGTGILLVPQRQPIYTARMVADLDYLSGGRVDLGIGIGWLAEEFGALGMDFSRRAANCREYVAAMKALWTQEIPEFHGPSIDIPRCYFNPKPVQRPHPPILVGGESDAALRRVAELGDGWYGFDLDEAQLAERLAKLDAFLAERGRKRADVQIFACPNRRRITPELIEGYRAQGVDQLIAPVFARSAPSQ